MDYYINTIKLNILCSSSYIILSSNLKVFTQRIILRIRKINISCVDKYMRLCPLDRSVTDLSETYPMCP